MHGAVSVLVNNAGITRDGMFRKMSKADWDAVISTNLDSLFNVTKQVIDEMTDAAIAYSVARMKEYGIVDSGDSEQLGIGAMTDQRIKSFFDLAVQAGLYPADLDLAKAYTLQFVNKQTGMELKSK